MQRVSTCSSAPQFSIIILVITAEISHIIHDKRRHNPSVLKDRLPAKNTGEFYLELVQKLIKGLSASNKILIFV